MTRRIYASVGEISSGTLRSEDLLFTFSGTLAAYVDELVLSFDQHRHFCSLLVDVENLDADDPEWDDKAGDLVDDLQDALNEIAPPGFYFGTSEGDVASFGFWECDLEEVYGGDLCDA